MKLGKIGEDIALNYLEKKGYKILDKNFRFGRFGEIDIIAVHNKNLVFIEVKTRSQEKFGFGFESVDKRKQKKIVKLALLYQTIKKLNNLNCRFDVISIMLDKEGQVKDINLIPNAFECS